MSHTVAPKISIGMPVYNGQPYLVDAVESLLAQTFDDFELIIADNASTDETEAICRDFAARDQRVRYVRRPSNIGAAANFSDVMRQSRGEYFRWAGADDICRPDYLRCCAKVLDERPDVILCYPQTDIIDAHGAVTEHFDDRLHLDHASPARRYADLLKHFRKANAVFGLIRADVLRQTRLIDAFPSSDVVLLGELAVRGKFFEVPQRLFLRRIHPQHSMLAYDTARARSYWFAARPKGSVFPYWREYCEHLRLDGRRALPLAQRIACLHYAFRRLHRHGRKVIWELLSGVPLAVAANLRPQRAVAVE